MRQGKRGGKEDTRMKCVWPAGPAEQVDNFVKLQAINSAPSSLIGSWVSLVIFIKEIE